MFRSHLFWRLYTGYVVIILTLTMVVGVMVSRQVTENERNEIQASLEVRSEFLAEVTLPYLNKINQSDLPGQVVQSGAVEKSLQATVTRLGTRTDSRLTVIAYDGTVIADSQELPENMDNHADRPEVLEAKLDSFSTAIRYSDTLQQKMIYRAIGLVDNDQNLIGFVRVSLALLTIDQKLNQLKLIVAAGAGSSAIVALLLGLYFASRFTLPLTHMTHVAEAISRGEFDKRIVINQADEIGQLAEAFNRMARNSQLRMNEITTERNRLAMIFTGMVEGVIGVDKNQNIIHINQAASSLLGISMTTSINKPIWEQVRIREINQAVEQAIKIKGVVKTQVRRVSELDDLVVDIYAAHINEHEGEQLGAVIVLNDVSELDHLERVRRDFVANASHELKTPITAIRGLAETILEDEQMEPDTQHRFIKKISVQSLRLSQLVTDLMTLSRLESALTKNEPQHVAFSEVVNRSIDALKLTCTDRNIVIKQKISEAIELDGDVQALSQLVDNLLDNAIKYTPEGGAIKVKLKLISSDYNQNKDQKPYNDQILSYEHDLFNGENLGNQKNTKHNAIEFKVSNSGPGISVENQKRIFERFYRVDKARSRELGGTGLGLSIVKNIAEQHGGDVSVTSRPGKGVKFTVRIPV